MFGINRLKEKIKSLEEKAEYLEKQYSILLEQKHLAEDDLNEVRDLLSSLIGQDLDDLWNVPVIGNISRSIRSYKNKINHKNNIEWARENGSDKKPVVFHGGCTGCKSPETIGIYRCLGCRYLMGVTSNYPDLSFK